MPTLIFYVILKSTVFSVFVLVQPDYEAQTLMEEAKFRQQLEQRSKRSEKKHGTLSSYPDPRGSQIPWIWILTFAELAVKSFSFKSYPDPVDMKYQESALFLICGDALKGLSHEMD
jgi:hypothetical protein